MNLLEENPFKIRSFEKAARIIESHPEEMGVLIDEDRLRDVDGIGETLAHTILYLAKSGGSSLEKELEARLPEGLPELLDLPGLGSKKVRILWQNHHILNKKQLHAACRTHQISKLKGFGIKAESKLLEAIQFQEHHARDFHLNQALEVAQRWEEMLSEMEAVQQVELTGTLRRRSELIQSIDFIVITERELFQDTLGNKFTLTASEDDRFDLEDESGLPIHIHCIDPEHFAAKQLVLTGGKAFMEFLDEKLVEHDATQEELLRNTIALSDNSEGALCESLSIQWIEPELRDAFYEFPQDQTLLEVEDVKGVFHAHSTWSDGIHSLRDMVETTRDLGYEYLGISDHSQAAYYANGLKPDRVKQQWNEIDELNEMYSDFHIFKGIEADILKDGELDYDDQLLAGFDFVIASIHSHFHLDTKTQTERLIRALQSPFTTMLGHPTGRMLLSRQGYAPDLPAVIEAASANDKIIEINTTPKRLDLDWRYLKMAKARGVKISINPDAHRKSTINTIPLGVMMARKGGLGPSDVMNTMNAESMKTYLLNRRKR